MVCVREPSDGDEVDGPFGIAVRVDMVVGGGGEDVVAVGKVTPPLIKTIVIGAAQPRLQKSRMFCARQVFRCFKFIEKLGERFVGAVGPYFVAAAVILISVGAVCFCTSGSPPTSAYI